MTEDRKQTLALLKKAADLASEALAAAEDLEEVVEQLPERYAPMRRTANHLFGVAEHVAETTGGAVDRAEGVAR